MLAVRISLVVLLVASSFGCSKSPPASPTGTQASASGDSVEAPEDERELPPPEALRFRVPVEGAPARGAAEPLVTVVVFSDFQCPHCARSAATLERLLHEHGDQVRVVFRHHPLPFHPHALPAAQAAIEARTQGGDEAFWRMHDALFANQTALDQNDLQDHARRLGLNADGIAEALDDQRHRATVQADQAMALGLGARGTPAHFINGRPLMGAVPYQDLEAIVRQEVALAKQLMGGGEPREGLYAAIMESAAPARPEPGPGAGGDAAPPDRTAVPVGDSPVRGPSDALVTIVEFVDFECAFCGRAQGTLEALRARYGDDLRIVFKHFPLPFHEHAMLAHEAAAEARAQKGDEGFWAMHERLFDDVHALSHDDLVAHAEALELDVSRFRQALDLHVHREAIERDVALGEQVGVQGTPMFFVNGEPVVGALPLPVFLEHVERGLERARALIERGASRAEVYERLVEGAKP